jgi:hypothetical protein
MEDALYAVVMASPAVTAILGDRFYPVDFPQAPVYPAALYLVVSRVRHVHMNGNSRLARSRLQVDAYALSFDELVALAEAISDALHAFRGLVTVEGVADPVEVQGVFSQNEIDLPETVVRQSGPRIRTRQLEFAIWF